MYNWKKILAIIPARWWSKWVPRKNIIPIANKPLICYTIDHARNSIYIDTYLVSSEDAEILQTASDYWCEVLERPPELSTDEALTGDVVMHALNTVDDEYDIIVLLQPTSPMRRKETIDQAIEAFEKHMWEYDSLMPLKPFEGKRGVIVNGSYQPNTSGETRRQSLDEEYIECWAIFIYKGENIKKWITRGERILPFIIRDHLETIDIDEPEDVVLATTIIEWGLYTSE